MREILITILKMGTVSFISAKAMKCLGKLEYANIISFLGWLGIGVEAIKLFDEFNRSIEESQIMKLMKVINKNIEDYRNQMIEGSKSNPNLRKYFGNTGSW